MRIRATKNVAKITNVMKLVASSKLRSVEEALYRGRAFGVRRNFFYFVILIYSFTLFIFPDILVYL